MAINVCLYSYKIRGEFLQKSTYLYSGGVDIKLLEDSESLLKQLVGNGNVGDVWSIIVIKSGNVFHDTCWICLYSCQYQQILKVPVVAEDGVFQDNFLQKLDELVGQVGSHEGTDRG